jgi:exosortase
MVANLMVASTRDGLLRLAASHGWLLLLFAAHVPLLAVHYLRLWEREHYRFFPFALLQCAALAFVRYDRSAGLRWTWDARCLLACDVAVLLVSSWVNSPWGTALGFCLLLAAVFRATRDRESDQSLLYLTTLPLLTLNLPLGYDFKVVLWLQSVTTRVASRLLLDMGYLHVRQGNVLHFPDRTFMVEEACSGVQSLFTLLFFAALLVCWKRCKLVHLLVLGLCAAGLAGLMNVLRVVAVAVAWESFGKDWSAGWRHEALGYVALAVASLMLVSAHALLAFLTGALPAEARLPRALLAKARLWNRLLAPQARAASAAAAPLGGGGLPLWVGAATACVCLFAVAAQSHAIWREYQRSPPRFEDARLGIFPQRLLPEELAGIKRQAYDEITRGEHDAMGHYSNTWTYADDSGPAMVSCDHPFRGWHDLTVCYRNAGWNVENSVQRSEEGWNCVVVQMFHPLEMKHAILAFSAFDEYGRPMPPPPANPWRAKLVQMLAGDADQPDSEHSVAYQSQVLAESPLPIGEQRAQQLLQVHLEARQRMRAALLPSGG